MLCKVKILYCSLFYASFYLIEGKGQKKLSIKLNFSYPSVLEYMFWVLKRFETVLLSTNNAMFGVHRNGPCYK